MITMNSLVPFLVLSILFLVCFFAMPEATKLQIRLKAVACIGIGILMAGLAYYLFVVGEAVIREDAASAIESFTSYDAVADRSTDAFDITVHETEDSKEVRFYDKVAAHDGLCRFTKYTRYYRIQKDLSYGRVPLDETSFVHDRD